MTPIRLTRVEHHVQQRDHVPPADPTRVIAGDCTIIDDETDETVAAVRHLPADQVDKLRAALAEVKYHSSGTGRASGLRYFHHTFGYRAKLTLRRLDWCSATLLNNQWPEAWAELQKLAVTAEVMLGMVNPAAAARHYATVQQVLPEWRIAGGLFTSGIINDTSALPYHVDRNNFDGTWSAQLTLRDKIAGGMLHLPDYDIYLPCADRSLLVFPGQRLIHGVTPFRVDRRATGAYRRSVVFYAIRGMRHCAPFVDELTRGRRIRTEREAV